MRKIFKYLQLSWRDRIMLGTTFLLLGLVRLAILLIPFRYLSVFLGQHMRETAEFAEYDTVYIRRVSWAIEVASRYTPWESKCLVQAITGKILLRRRRLQNTLYLGVAKKSDSTLMAHAWLRCGTYSVTGGCGGKFTAVSKFSDIF